MRGLVLIQRERIEQQDRIFRSLGLRLKWLSVAISIAAIIVPIVLAIVAH